METKTEAQIQYGRVAAGIDIGGTKIAIGLVDDNGNMIVRAEIPTYVDRGPEYALTRILETLKAQTEQTGVTIAGVGIGCTGPVDPITGRLGNVNTLPRWQGWNPVLGVSEALGVSAAMENDADAAALGEAYWGAGKGKRSVICITFGTGIGAGVLLNGEIYRGVNNSHPELGHHIVEPSGPPCTCGTHGCWESLASGPAMELLFKEQNVGVPVDAKEICARARAGDPGAALAVEREAKYLGMGLANVISIWMPEAILLCGSLMHSADLFLEGIQEVVVQNCRLVSHRECHISVTSLGSDVGVIGAAQVWRYRFQCLSGRRQ